MHELSVTQGLLDLALKEAEKYKAKKIIKINITMGGLTGYDPFCIEEYLHLLGEGTPAEHTELEFNILPGKIACLDCQKEQSARFFRSTCMYCNSPRLKVISGQEFYIENMEIED